MSLIILEGLPSTGKSTNSRILLSQLKRNGFRAKWFHEDSRPHPTSFFYEACLTKSEYEAFLLRFPGVIKILDTIKVVRANTVCFDLLDIRWNYLSEVGIDAFDVLQEYDVWNFPLKKYCDVALEKWEHFVKQADQDEVVILDSSFFQFQIYTFLLENTSYGQLETFIKRLSVIIAKLNPTLIYLTRKDVEDTINDLEKTRGIQFLERIWERDQQLPYYLNRPSGAEGYREFLRDYDKITRKLFDMIPFDKISLDITDGRWNSYEKEILDHFKLKHCKPPEFLPPTGIYKNMQTDLQIVVEGSTIVDPTGKRKKLFPISQNEFDIEDLSVILHFESPDKLIMAGQQLSARWTTYGTTYRRVKE